MSETTGHFLAEPRLIADTPEMQETQKLLDAVRLVSEHLPIAHMPLHIEPTLERRVKTYQDQYDEAQSRTTEEVSLGAARAEVVEALSVPREDAADSGTVVIKLPENLEGLPENIEAPKRLRRPTFRMDPPTSYGHC